MASTVWRSRSIGRHSNPARSTSPPAEEPHRRTILDTPKGHTVRIVDVVGGRRTAHRLISLGLVPGATVTVLRPSGPGLVSVNGTRIALDRLAARAVAVEEMG